ncbi:MAG: SAM-dependent methyltransferase [Ferruginibacter sp.]
MIELSNIIIEQIRKEGPISFRDFMEKSLYYPGLGYYTSAKEHIGKEGDFYTSSSLTPAFGAMIAKQLQQLWHITGETYFTIVEFGAGTGLLCRDILDFFKAFPELYQHINYCIIEKSPVMRERQKKHLYEKVSWYPSVAALGEFTGCVLSNEVVDNFSVHQVVMEDELMEIFVDHSDDAFVEVKKPASEPIKQYFKELEVKFQFGFRTEINLEAITWLQEISLYLKKGFVITIDYGALSEELYSQRKNSGTLLCFKNHTINDTPFKDIGKQDITSHVNFSALAHWGDKCGLALSGYTTQANFLLALGFKAYLSNTILSGENILAAVKKESFISRQLLLEMGTKFKVLVQRKGIPHQPLLGFSLT